jgi:OOP family OmpA-OmpF porin
MKSTSKILSIATLAMAAGMVISCAPQTVSDYPHQVEIPARQINPSHRLNTCPMGVTKIEVVVNFDTASDKLSARGAAQVQKAAAIINDPSFQGSHVTVEGYTDAAGKDAANLDLSYRRALTVMHVLVDQYGVPASMLSAQGFGKANPVATNSTAAGRMANRRVVFMVSK